MHLPQVLRLRGSVIRRIWWQILLLVTYTAIIVFIHMFDAYRFNFPQTLIPVLGVVTGLLLVFRTNTAYDRYYEGRKVWSTMTLNIRTIARCIWVMVKEDEKVKCSEIVGKISAINLLVAFAFSTKNYLRGEECNEEDEKSCSKLIINMPTFPKPVVCSLPSVSNVNGNPGMSSKANKHSIRKKDRRERDVTELTTSTNVPLELSYYLATYIHDIGERGLADRPVMNMMNNSLSSLVDCLGRFERILETPIPFAYSVHLVHCTWIYLLALPYQLVEKLEWFTIPAVALAAFALLGILSIGREIENPFGYDSNDLPLDRFCQKIFIEISKITGGKMLPPSSWIMAGENQPLQPVSQLKAENLAKLEETQIHSILSDRASLALHGTMGYTNGGMRLSMSKEANDLEIVSVTDGVGVDGTGQTTLE